MWTLTHRDVCGCQDITWYPITVPFVHGTEKLKTQVSISLTVKMLQWSEAHNPLQVPRFKSQPALELSFLGVANDGSRMQIPDTPGGRHGLSSGFLASAKPCLDY